MKLCKFGIHKWPKGIKDINDWLWHPDDSIDFVEEEDEHDRLYLRCKCPKCGKKEIRRFPHHYFSVYFYNLWKRADFFTFIWMNIDKSDEAARGDFNSILENRYQLIFLNFEIEIFTKPRESAPGQPFHIHPGGHRDITPEEYKEKYGYFPLDSKEYEQEQKDKQSG